MGRIPRDWDSFVEYDTNGGCHLWSGSLSTDGYPVFRKKLATRKVIEDSGIEPGDWLACHKCHVRVCVRDDHLYAGTGQENMRDAQIRGTFDNLHRARDEQWAKQGWAARQKRVSRGVQGIRSWWADKTPEERSRIARERAQARWSPTIQTFLPFPNFACSAMVLDRRRLNRQVQEARQILAALRNGGGWRNHPAVRMWQGHAIALRLYHDVCLREWLRRGYASTQGELLIELENVTMPPWLGDEALHASHRAALLEKDPAHYRQFGWEEQPRIEYVWPSASESARIG